VNGDHTGGPRARRPTRRTHLLAGRPVDAEPLPAWEEEPAEVAALAESRPPVRGPEPPAPDLAPAEGAGAAEAAEPVGAGRPRGHDKLVPDDFDWAAFVGESLGEGEDAPPGDARRVTIRLPEAAALQSESDVGRMDELFQLLDPGTAERDPDVERVILNAPLARGSSGPEEIEVVDEPAAGARRETPTRDWPRAASGDQDTRDWADMPTPGGGSPRPGADADTADWPADGRGDEETRNWSSGQAGAAPPPAPPPQQTVSELRVVDVDPAIHLRGRHPAAAELDRLFLQVFLRPTTSRPRIVLVASAHPGEGRTTVALNLALAAARAPTPAGALVVDADPQGRGVLPALGLAQPVNGLLDAVREGSKDYRGLLVQVPAGELDVLPLGAQGSEPERRLGSAATNDLLRSIRELYPFGAILVDGPPVLSPAAAVTLHREIDGVLLVVRADRTPRRDVEKAVAILGRERVLGVVLNRG